MSEEFIKFKQSIKNREIRLKKDKEKLKQICLHENLKLEEGYIDYQGWDRDYINGNIECLDCGLYAYEDNKELYNKLLHIYKNNK